MCNIQISMIRRNKNIIDKTERRETIFLLSSSVHNFLKRFILMMIVMTKVEANLIQFWAIVRVLSY